jgi:hypothetical protein
MVAAQVVAKEHGKDDESEPPQAKPHQDDPLLVHLQRFGVGATGLVRHGSTIGRTRSGRLAASTSGPAASGKGEAAHDRDRD